MASLRQPDTALRASHEGVLRSFQERQARPQKARERRRTPGLPALLRRSSSSSFWKPAVAEPTPPRSQEKSSPRYEESTVAALHLLFSALCAAQCAGAAVFESAPCVRPHCSAREYGD